MILQILTAGLNQIKHDTAHYWYHFYYGDQIITAAVQTYKCWQQSRSAAAVCRLGTVPYLWVMKQEAMPAAGLHAGGVKHGRGLPGSGLLSTHRSVDTDTPIIVILQTPYVRIKAQ
jgi:hypothetical protein